MVPDRLRLRHYGESRVYQGTNYVHLWQILKMDSTKKIVRKLARHSAGTALWATNVGNEMGQVLMGVLTASEGVGLAPMTNGLMTRYSTAGVAPPQVLYVDHDCCAASIVKTKELFDLWPDLLVSLDI